MKSNSLCLIAIDPGASGGIAVRFMGKVITHKMPETDGDVLDLLAQTRVAAAMEHLECVCYLERVSGYAGSEQPGSAMFRFGEGYGFLKGCVQALGIRLVMVGPREWQKGLGVGKRTDCETRTIWKNALKGEAQRRYPGVKVTLAISDSLLILDYAVRQLDGELLLAA